MAQLQIPAELTSATFTVSAPQTEFPFTFAVFSKADLRFSVNGVELTQADFTLSGTVLSGGGYQGGIVTLNTAVSSATCILWRQTIAYRTSNFASALAVPVRDIDVALNRLTAMIQDTQQVHGTIVVNPPSIIAGAPTRVWPEQYDETAGSGGDDTAALQACLTAGGVVLLGAKTYNYTTLSIQKPVRVVGANQGTDSTSTRLNCTSSTNTVKVSIGNGAAQLDGVRLEHLTMSAPSSTGGSLVFMNWVADSTLYDIQMVALGDTSRGVKFNRCNAIGFERMRIIEPVTSGIYGYGDDAHRSDDIQIINLIVSGNSLGAATHIPNAVEIDGFVNTVIGHHWNLNGCGRGIYKRNTVGATQRGEYIEVHDLEVDYPYYEGIRIEWGDGFYFTAPYLHGSVTTQNVYIAHDAGTSISNISFIGGNCTGAAQEGMLINGRYVRVMGMGIFGNSTASVGTKAGVRLGANAVAALILGNQMGQESGIVAGTHSYSVQIDNGSVEHMVAYNNMIGNVTGTVLDLSSIIGNRTSIIGPNLGDPVPGSNTATVPADGFHFTLTDQEELILIPAAGLATGRVTMPASPIDRQMVRVWSSQAIAALTVDASGGDSINADALATLTALAAGGGFTMRYTRSSATWYRVA